MTKVNLMLGDCLERMSEIPDGSVDMILADLPYGITRCHWDSVIPLEPLWAQYWRVLKKPAAVVLFAAQPFGSILVSSKVERWKQTLIWKKNKASNFLNAKRQHLAIHEEIHVFSLITPKYFPQMQIGKPYKRNRGTGKDDTGNCYGAIKQRTDTVNEGTRYPTTILDFPRETGLHPTQKPVPLLEYLIRTYTNEGETVLDNVMGSGSTGVACLNANRKFIGIEKDDAYFEIAKKRIGECLG